MFAQINIYQILAIILHYVYALISGITGSNRLDMIPKG